MWGISSKFSVQVAGASLFPLELEIWFTLGSAQGWMLLMATSPCVKVPALVGGVRTRPGVSRGFPLPNRQWNVHERLKFCMNMYIISLYIYTHTHLTHMYTYTYIYIYYRHVKCIFANIYVLSPMTKESKFILELPPMRPGFPTTVRSPGTSTFPRLGTTWWLMSDGRRCQP